MSLNGAADSRRASRAKSRVNASICRDARATSEGGARTHALAAARALLDGAGDAELIARRSLEIAADICVYTNRNITIETL